MPHTAATLADRAALAVRELALLTRPAITPLHVEDVRSVTAALAELAAGLPQTLHQLSRHLLDSAESPITTHCQPSSDAPTTADHARIRLRHAAAEATHLAAALDAAHQTLGDIADTIESNLGGSKFNRR